MNRRNLLILKEEGIDINNIDFVSNAIKEYEEDDYADEGISKSKLDLETEEIIKSLRDDRKISKVFEVSLRLRPLELRLKKLDSELSFRAGAACVFFDDTESPIYDYYSKKRKAVKNLRLDYCVLKRNGISKDETELDTLRKQKIKLMRKNKK